MRRGEVRESSLPVRDASEKSVNTTEIIPPDPRRNWRLEGIVMNSVQ